MSTTYPMYADLARIEVAQRLREADDVRRRRLARRGAGSSRRGSDARARHLPWR